MKKIILFLMLGLLLSASVCGATKLPQPLLRVPVSDLATSILQKNNENLEYHRRQLYNGTASLEVKSMLAGGGFKFPDGTTQLTAALSIESYTASLATTITATGANNIAEQSLASFIITTTGTYLIIGHSMTACVVGMDHRLSIKTGSATYASATLRCKNGVGGAENTPPRTCFVSALQALSSGDTVHLGGILTGDSGNKYIYGDSTSINCTSIQAIRVN